MHCIVGLCLPTETRSPPTASARPRAEAVSLPSGSVLVGLWLAPGATTSRTYGRDGDLLPEPDRLHFHFLARSETGFAAVVLGNGRVHGLAPLAAQNRAQRDQDRAVETQQRTRDLVLAELGHSPFQNRPLSRSS
jgi:hypothetical protein